MLNKEVKIQILNKVNRTTGAQLFHSSNYRSKNHKERPNRVTNNGDMAEIAKQPLTDNVWRSESLTFERNDYLNVDDKSQIKKKSMRQMKNNKKVYKSKKVWKAEQ